MSEITFVEAINQALRRAMTDDERVVILGQDIATNGGVFRATQGLFSEFGKERVLDTPLAESGIAGTAIGMAINGLRPIAEIQFLPFALVCFNQITTQAARMRYRSGGVYTVPLVIRTPFGGGVRPPLIWRKSRKWSIHGLIRRRLRRNPSVEGGSKGRFANCPWPCAGSSP